MFNNILNIAKRIIVLSEPKMWAYSGGLFIFGISVGFFNLVSVGHNFIFSTLSVIRFLAYFIWFLMMANIFSIVLNNYFNRHENANNQKKIRYGIISKDDDKRAVIAGTVVAIISFITINILFPSFKILILAFTFFFANFLYNIPPIREKRMPLTAMAIGPIACSLTTLLSGYVFVTNTWPNFLMVIAATFYFLATGLYNKVIDMENDCAINPKLSFWRKQNFLLMCLLFLFLCGLILAFKNPIYSSVIIPYAIIIILSLYTKDQETMLKIYSKTFVVNNILGFLATSYFFTIPSGFSLTISW